MDVEDKNLSAWPTNPQDIVFFLFPWSDGPTKVQCQVLAKNLTVKRGLSAYVLLTDERSKRRRREYQGSKSVLLHEVVPNRNLQLQGQARPQSGSQIKSKPQSKPHSDAQAHAHAQAQFSGKKGDLRSQGRGSEEAAAAGAKVQRPSSAPTKNSRFQSREAVESSPPPSELSTFVCVVPAREGRKKVNVRTAAEAGSGFSGFDCFVSLSYVNRLLSLKEAKVQGNTADFAPQIDRGELIIPKSPSPPPTPEATSQTDIPGAHQHDRGGKGSAKVEVEEEEKKAVKVENITKVDKAEKNVGKNEEFRENGENGENDEGVRGLKRPKPDLEEARNTGVQLSVTEGGRQAKVESVPRQNGELLTLLERIRGSYSSTGDVWRERAYKQAIRAITECGFQIRNERDLKRDWRLAKIGSHTRNRICEFLNTGEIADVKDKLDSEQTKVVEQFWNIWGVGHKTAEKLWSQGIRSLQQLREESEKNEKVLTVQQRVGLKYYDEFLQKMTRAEVERCCDRLREALASDDRLKEIEVVPGGSYRRGAPRCGDCDVLIFSPNYQTNGRRSRSRDSDEDGGEEESGRVGNGMSLSDQLLLLMHILEKDGFLKERLTSPTPGPNPSFVAT